MVFIQNDQFQSPYKVENPGQFCNALMDARVHFGSSIDVLTLNGHANNDLLVLARNSGYFFTSDQEETNCMNETLSSTAQVFLLGCNTATPHYSDRPTLTTRVSRGLLGREITGFAAFYNPFFTTSSFFNGRFQHDNHIPANLNGLVSPITTAVSETS